MNTAEWLSAKTYGYSELSNEERGAITDVFWLWSVFEAQLLGKHANAKRIREAVYGAMAAGKLNPEQFNDALAYFRNRYVQDGNTTTYFTGLRLRKADLRDFVRNVLTGSEDAPIDRVVAVLIVVLRLRNNLIHGIKWDYGIAGQRENFLHASHALRQAVEQDWPPLPEIDD